MGRETPAEHGFKVQVAVDYGLEEVIVGVRRAWILTQGEMKDAAV